MSDSKPNNFFSPDEVNVLIPRLEEHFRKFWSYREDAQNIIDELRSQNRKSQDLLVDEIVHLQLRKSQSHFLLEQAKKELDAIMEFGCSIKDLEAGLVDFPHMLEYEEQEVYLCWKYGEKKVRFWHEIDKGFSARKPLSVRKIQH